MGHTVIYQGKSKFSWNPLPLVSTYQKTTHTGQPRFVRDFEQSLLLWAIS